MIKIAVLTDVHGNLPALRAAIFAISRGGFWALFHTGDLVGIGPQPEECISLLTNLPSSHFVKGNHDAWLVDGLPSPTPPWMSEGEVAHHQWQMKQVSDEMKQRIAEWPYYIEREIEGVRLVFTHYGLTLNGRDFVPIIQEPSIVDLDQMFEQHHADVVFYGHHHPYSDREGRARYVNPGSVGCYREAVARFAYVYLQGGRYWIEHHAVPYDDAPLFAQFEQKQVPEREFLYRAFFGGRFQAG